MDYNSSQFWATFADFVCNNNPRNAKQACLFKRDYERIPTGGKAVSYNTDINLKDVKWDGFIQELNPSPEIHNGYCILFIPAAADTYKGVPTTFTSIPISSDNWEKVAEFLYIPKYYEKVMGRQVSSLVSISREKDGKILRMSVGKTTSKPNSGFAFASTYFEDRHFSSAIMVGCSDDQIKMVTKYLSSSKGSSQHPFFMHSIFAELELRELEGMVGGLKIQYENSKGELEQRRSNFDWGFIRSFLINRDNFHLAKLEVDEVKLQLDKLHGQLVSDDGLKGDYFTTLFLARLNDMTARLEGYSGQCQQFADSISYWTELIRSELAREEASQSAKNSKLATLIGGVALVYLPVTGVATILAMPIFGWTNDWKNLHLKSIEANGQSNGSSADTGSAGAASTGLPVVSGYIWIWVIASAILSILTVGPFIYRLELGILSFFHKYYQKLKVALASARSLNGRNLGGSGTPPSQVPSGVP
ncbi:hypothetical protein GGS24DRAFT_461614 [Hypoxylon argillaceum]|nr:hypothetical protein GGS24DRAFT_461614 [Hypoxylon argillaceum]